MTSDRTPSVHQSRETIKAIAEDLTQTFGYTAEEAWAMIADKIMYCHEEHVFDPLSASDALDAAGVIIRFRIIGDSGEHNND